MVIYAKTSPGIPHSTLSVVPCAIFNLKADKLPVAVCQAAFWAKIKKV
jgi:hypothetical protein